jgi:RNA polymerase sigma-70 factor (ECF subfamily)
VRALAIGQATPVALTLADVYEQHGTLLVRWTTRLVGPGADRDDALQEVLLQVHRSLPRFRGEARITTWLYQLTTRVVQRMRRRENLRRWLFGEPEDAAFEVPSLDAGPAVRLEQRQTSAALYRALDHLSEKNRTAFLLFEMEQLSAEEIAQIMETKPGTVWVWVHRARARLRELMEDVP